MNNSSTANFSRAPKQLGDFGEGLVTYALIRQGFEVAVVDHVGADLIAEKNEYKIAVSVKTRMFRKGSVESRGTGFDSDHLKKLEHFAKRFNLDPVVAHAACMIDDHKIHLFMIRVADIHLHIKKCKGGYSFQYSPKRLKDIIALPYVDYSCWTEENIGKGLSCVPIAPIIEPCQASL